MVLLAVAEAKSQKISLVGFLVALLGDDGTPFHVEPDQVVPWDTRGGIGLRVTPKLLEPLVAQYEPVIGVIEHEAFGKTLDSVDQLGFGFGERLLGLLALGDIGEDADVTARRRLAVADVQPAPVAELEIERAPGTAPLGDAGPEMVLLAVAEALDGALLDVQADQVLEVNPGGDLGIGVVVEVLVCAVA